MSHKELTQKEEILHQFWANGIFAQHFLESESGLGIEIIHPGDLNHLDGPDFLNARIRIGSLVHYGAVEIHRRSKDWFYHKHHLDKNYDKVILHVVAEENQISQVHTSAGIYPPTLNVINFLPKKYELFLKNRSDFELPCNRIVHSLSNEVFDRQIEIAQKEYFDQKVSHFFRFYNEHLTPSEAWRRSLFITLCDALGVPSNRDSMKIAAKQIIEKLSNGDVELYKDREIIDDLLLNNHWIKKGSRRKTNPKFRLQQALNLFHFLNTKSLDFFIDTPFQSIWSELLQVCGLKRTSHNHRLFISFFLPAMYGLGVIVHSHRLKKASLTSWYQSEIEVPKSILQQFDVFDTHFSSKSMKRIGLVHQFNSYCKPKHCSKCEVLNKAISS